MVFDVYGNDRLVAWKEFRDSLETSEHPLEDVAKLWSQAPFVSAYLDPQDPTKWPDPWHLIIDLRLDNLAIALGILYTIKLTQRFIDTKCEIHMSILPNNEPMYLVIVDDARVLNFEYRNVVDITYLKDVPTSLLHFRPKIK